MIIPIALLKAIIAKRQQAVLITLFSLDKKIPQPGTCLLMTEDEKIRGIHTTLNDVLITEAKKVLFGRQSSFRNYTTESQNFTAFVEWITPSISLVIGGAGNDVIPLVEMAEILGWVVTLVDGRPAYAKKERFSASCQVVLARPEEVLRNIFLDEQTVFVLISHNYNYDLALLRQLIKHDIAYVGLLGPRKKFERMLNELEEEGIHLTEQQMAVIHSPVGLDIGAESPEEIALSIVSEIKAVLSLKEGASLKHKDVIHERSHTRISEIKPDPQ
jgi:xanthine/CO dehydrogenase XdhC/CoxF family maturation factor